MGQGEGDREVGKGIRRERENQLPWKQLQRKGVKGLGYRGSVAPLASSHPFLTQDPLGHFVLPYSGEFDSVQWAFIAHKQLSAR